jgi:hypothetical protein
MPKKAFALPAMPSTMATLNVAKAIRFIGRTPEITGREHWRVARPPVGQRSEMEGATPVPPTSDL